MPARRPFAFGKASLNVIRGLSASALVLGCVTFTAASAGAQSDEDAGTYEAPTFGYTLEWDADAWTVEGEAEAADNAGRDYLSLAAADTFAQLFVEGSDEAWSDTDDCVSTLIDESAAVFAEPLNLEDAPADGEAIDDFELSGDDHSRAAYVLDVAVDEGEVPVAFFAECYADPDGDYIVGFSGATVEGDDFLEDGYATVAPVIESLPFADASGGDDDDSTPVAGGGRGDDETPVAGGGVDGDTYTGTNHPFQVQFDEDVWTVEGDSSEDDVDTLLLSSDSMFATVSAFESTDGVDGCVDTHIDVLDARGDGDAAVVTNSDTGEDLVFPSDDGSEVRAFFFYSIDGSQLANYLVCVDIGDDVLLTIDFTSDGATLASEEGMEQIDGLLGGVAF